MTVTLAATLEDETGDVQLTAAGHAEWTARAGAFGVDVLPGLGLAACLLLIGWSAAGGGWLRLPCLVAAAAVLLAVMVNRWLLPSVTGWSLGRSVFGIAVLNRDGMRPGPWRLLLRDAAHLLDTLPLLLGWLWPLLDSRGRTFADLLVGTEVRPLDSPPADRPRLAGALAVGAALLALLVAGLGYLTVYHHQQEVARAREHIGAAGPKIVADMLTYTAETADDDFANAQKLVTDDYRPQLTAQQDAVRKAGLVDNNYWVTDSAVVSASEDRATMLLLMQGQRGTAPKQRFITASLRVGFARSAAGQWQVSDLTVLTPPKPAQGAAPPPAKPDGPPPKPAQPSSPTKTGAGG